MYARRLKLMEALERKLAPLEKYHMDVVGLCEDTREEIAFLRKKIGMIIPTADGMPGTQTEGEEGMKEKQTDDNEIYPRSQTQPAKDKPGADTMVEDASIKAEDHGLDSVMLARTQDVEVKAAIASKQDVEREQDPTRGGVTTLGTTWDFGLWRNVLPPSLFQRSSPKRARDIIPTRLQLLQKTRMKQRSRDSHPEN